MANVIHVEVAWETDPLTRPGVSDWTRLGSVDAKLLVESLGTSRGADIRTGAVEAGEASTVINDPNGNLDPSNGRSAWGQRVVTDGVTTNTDATVTSASAVFSAFDVGKAVTGTGIPASTTIASVTSATEVELSAAATATGTGVSLTIGVASVLPRRRVRFVIDAEADVLTWDGDLLLWGGEGLSWGTEEAVLWTGFLRNIPIKWRKQVQWTSITAAGIIWLLSEISLPPSVLHIETLALAPAAYWPMTETVGRVAEDVAGTLDGTYARTVTSTGQLVPFDSRPNVIFKRPDDEDSAGQAVSVTPVPIDSTAGFSLSLWWSCKARPVNYEIPAVATLATDSWLLAEPSIRMSVDRYDASLNEDGDALRLDVYGGGAYGFRGARAYPGYGLFDGAPHHFVFTLTGAGSLHLYIDGVDVDLVSTGPDGPIPGTSVAASLAQMTRLDMGWGPFPYSGTSEHEAAVGHFAYWDSVITAADVAAIYEAGTNPWANDLTGARLNRILDLGGVDALDRDIDTGTQNCGPTLLAGQNLMEYCRKIAATEGGQIYEDAEGRLAFRERVANSPTAVAVFSDDPTGDNGYPVAPLDPDFSLDRVINYAEVTRENGVTQSAEDATSRAKYGDKSVSLDTLHSSPSYARSTAARLTIRNKDPRLVFRQVVADGIDVANSVQLETDVGDAVEVIARPPRGGDPIDQTSIVERVEHDLEGHRWFTTFGVAEHTVLPDFWWNEPGQGWDESVWVPPAA